MPPHADDRRLAVVEVALADSGCVLGPQQEILQDSAHCIWYRRVANLDVGSATALWASAPAAAHVALGVAPGEAPVAATAALASAPAAAAAPVALAATAAARSALPPVPANLAAERIAAD